MVVSPALKRVILVLACALAVAPAAAAATTPTLPSAPVVKVAPAHLTKKRALAIFERDPKVANWLTRYPKKGLTDAETYDPKSTSWNVQLWSGKAGEIAQGKVDDTSGYVLEAWTGPQVAWTMARGLPGAFGGKTINSPWLWGVLCAAFLLGLADLRRPMSLRNLDLALLLSPTASLWFFNHGDVFTAAPLIYPVLVWVIVRGIWIGVTGRGSPARSSFRYGCYSRRPCSSPDFGSV